MKNDFSGKFITRHEYQAWFDEECKVVADFWAFRWRMGYLCVTNMVNGRYDYQAAIDAYKEERSKNVIPLRRKRG